MFATERSDLFRDCDCKRTFFRSAAGKAIDKSCYKEVHQCPSLQKLFDNQRAIILRLRKNAPLTTNSLLSPLYSMLVQIASIISSPTHLDGQDNRSSGNFSTKVIPSATKKFLWKVTQSGVENEIIRFDVARPRKLRHDPVVYSQVHNNYESSADEHDALYISDPDGAAGKIFLVTVFAI